MGAIASAAALSVFAFSAFALFGPASLVPASVLLAGIAVRRGFAPALAALAAFAAVIAFFPPPLSIESLMLMGAASAAFFACFLMACTPARIPLRSSALAACAAAAALPAFAAASLYSSGTGALASLDAISPVAILAACGLLLAAALSAVELQKQVFKSRHSQ